MIPQYLEVMVILQCLFFATICLYFPDKDDIIVVVFDSVEDVMLQPNLLLVFFWFFLSECCAYSGCVLRMCMCTLFPPVA